MLSPLQYVRTVNSMLAECDSSLWAKRWVDFRMDFTRRYSNGYIFSTRFGIDFFQEIESFLLGEKFLTPPKGESLSEYDRNFNMWLKMTRGIK